MKNVKFPTCTSGNNVKLEVHTHVKEDFTQYEEAFRNSEEPYIEFEGDKTTVNQFFMDYFSDSLAQDLIPEKGDEFVVEFDYNNPMDEDYDTIACFATVSSIQHRIDGRNKITLLVEVEFEWYVE